MLKMAAVVILDNVEWPYLRNGSLSTYIVHIAACAWQLILQTIVLKKAKIKYAKIVIVWLHKMTKVQS